MTIEPEGRPFSEADALGMYLGEVRRFRTMTSVEEQRTLARLAEGDNLAAGQLAEALCTLTADTALAAAPDGMEPLEAIEQANIVMVRVIQACPQGDLHDELRRAITEHLGGARPES